MSSSLLDSFGLKSTLSSMRAVPFVWRCISVLYLCCIGFRCVFLGNKKTDGINMLF